MELGATAMERTYMSNAAVSQSKIALTPILRADCYAIYTKTTSGLTCGCGLYWMAVSKLQKRPRNSFWKNFQDLRKQTGGKSTAKSITKNRFFIMDKRTEFKLWTALT